jgi:hypothetical protein
MNVILTSGEAILRKTPDMLPPLKAAGVVDSGGRGLLLIYTGYVAVMRGEEIADPAALLAGDCSVVEEDIRLKLDSVYLVGSGHAVALRQYGSGLQCTFCLEQAFVYCHQYITHVLILGNEGVKSVRHEAGELYNATLYRGEILLCGFVSI